MTIPTTRTEFRDLVLRRVGMPVLEVNVSEEQIDDLLDKALWMYRTHHYDGVIQKYFAHQFVADDLTNRWVAVPDGTMGVTRIFPISITTSSSNLFNLRYQFVLNDLYMYNNLNIVPYYIAMQNVALIQEVLVGQQFIRYSRNQERLYLDMDWSIINVGDWMVAETYTTIDPADFPLVWQDVWLQDYATCLIEEQWGKHLTKFKGVMVGGIEFNGEGILARAREDKEKLEYQLIHTYSAPVLDFLG